MKLKTESALPGEAHTAERNSICGVHVELNVDGERFVMIMLGADGSIRRLGMGSLNESVSRILTGSTDSIVFQQVRQKVTPHLLQWKGQAWSDPAPRGKTCELIVQFTHADGRETKIHWWYGSESQEPPSEIRTFVLAAVEATRPWYEQSLERERRRKARHDDSWGLHLSS